MKINRIPDLLTIHLKRFNCTIRWREKIRTRVDFPITGLDMSRWVEAGEEKDCLYDLIGVVNHLGGMQGGHYVSTVKATKCTNDGFENVAHSFNGKTVEGEFDRQAVEATSAPTGRKMSKEEQQQEKLLKANRVNSTNATSSADPLWLLADDDAIHPISPRQLVSEGAYCLFYRKRNLSSYNMAHTATL